MEPEIYIGLMSGTSLDAIDVALVDFSKKQPELIATHQEDIPKKLRQSILDLCYPGDQAIQRMGETDVKLGRLFAHSVAAILQQEKCNPSNIQAIGSHGQTIRHVPTGKYPFTLQIGDPNIIAAETGITTVADFRRRDMALGGQAAPLTPAFHDYLFRDRRANTAVLNIGGIANITMLPKDLNAPIQGFDTGPGNTLMDAWCLKHTQQPYDKDGGWAKSGTCDNTLLTKLIHDDYFSKAPPKSTGREYFHLSWLEKYLKHSENPADVQATLLELTARSAVDCFNQSHTTFDTLWVCGGGANNSQLLNRLKMLCHCKINTTEAMNLPPNWVEATAFAWLAQQTMKQQKTNIPSVTGARTKTILGAIYYGI
jgi:anhydro-N-acetylmuramic acid kinase